MFGSVLRVGRALAGMPYTRLRTTAAESQNLSGSMSSRLNLQEYEIGERRPVETIVERQQTIPPLRRMSAY
jgi:hypothetical protein